METGKELVAVDMVGTALTPERMTDQINLIQRIMEKNMKKDIHYGVIPGTDKPTLLQPGAEKLMFVFRLSAIQENRTIELGNGHREEKVLTRLVHIPSGAEIGQGWGSCSTMESKYRWRLANISCPACGKETIIKGKEEYGGGWVCYAKKGGCGAHYDDNDEKITKQPRGQIENLNIADLYNTVLKIACKRSLISAVKSSTAASDIYNQDIDEEHIRKAVNLPTGENGAAPEPNQGQKELKEIIEAIRRSPKARQDKARPVVEKYLTSKNKSTDELTTDEAKELSNLLRTI